MMVSLALAGALAVLAPIFRGTPTSGFPEVAGIGIRESNGVLSACTGTLIAPRVVLTAAHCVEDANLVGAVFFPGDGSRLEIYAEDWVVHPDYQGFYADLALVYLSSPAGAILPATLVAERPGHRRAAIVGFGADGDDVTLRKREGTVKLRRRCPRRGRPRAGLPPGALAGSICWKGKRRGNDVCVGDSGGPLYVDGLLAGVHSGKISRHPTGCPGSLSWATDVALFRDWIDAGLAAAGP